MTVDMVTLPEPQSGAKRPKLITPKNDALGKSFGYSEVLIWLRDGALRGGHW